MWCLVLWPLVIFTLLCFYFYIAFFWGRFDVDAPDFFTDSVKITVASYILEREKFGPEDQNKGIKQLLAEGVYKAAYPLHDVFNHKFS